MLRDNRPRCFGILFKKILLRDYRQENSFLFLGQAHRGRPIFRRPKRVRRRPLTFIRDKRKPIQRSLRRALLLRQLLRFLSSCQHPPQILMRILQELDLIVRLLKRLLPFVLNAEHALLDLTHVRVHVVKSLVELFQGVLEAQVGVGGGRLPERSLDGHSLIIFVKVDAPMVAAVET